ncbi:hypothetical protein [Flavilitoribacter nigricans]|uniref:Uncharacterized protein n=1 Tax=Flavilitoribacter nigricans (strain ATCC 23147 / DSM 23189 / NBRC 102662 / NCIMB 1420 / SS-2) TaxID=1122177 RepID=A0A2D0NKD6_FLAN2|nr:hypothetical protein [Flavilitoribacter nigricans]PHN08203.1 hypothetical protein CRP01_02455 [Flavilitoribacter nigricans DSM 23189 = NBRC 102662]
MPAKPSSFFFVYPNKMRILGIILILGAILIFIYRMTSFNIVDLSGASFPVAFGLILIFFSKEKDSDERTVYLKFKALALGVPLAAVIVMLINYYYNFAGYSIETDSWYSISAFEYLSLALILALGAFHYLKYKE